MKTNIKSKKEIKNLIRKELATILISVNPAIDKRDFKKSIEKAEKILFNGATKKRKKNNPVQVDHEEELLIKSQVVNNDLNEE